MEDITKKVKVCLYVYLCYVLVGLSCTVDTRNSNTTSNTE